MPIKNKLLSVAETDQTFEIRDGLWVGKCLICNGPLAFDPASGEGATLEHIRAKSRGGTEDLGNLALVHGSCNHEKGRRWDPKRRRSSAEYEEFIERLLQRRADRWRDPPPSS